MADIEITAEPQLITDIAQERGKRGTFQTTFVFGGLKKHLNPNEAAAFDLKTALDKFRLDEPTKRDYSNSVIGMPQLISMNKTVMAACFYMLYSSNIEWDRSREPISPTDFNRTFEDIYPFLDQGKEGERKSPAEIKRAYKEECLRYIWAIWGYRRLQMETLNTE